MQGEVEGPRAGDRFILWMGTQCTSRDIPPQQTEPLLLLKDFVLSPLPETEKFLKLQNMKQFQCCIIQLCDPAGNPYIETLPYAMLLNDLSSVTNWICTAEYNKDGIFHAHAMLQTGARSDSLRRTMETAWQNLCLSSNFQYHFGQQSTFDCLKIQRCHKPESMLGYMMKAPAWVLSNSEPLLQACYDLDYYNLNERFKKSEEAIISNDINKMTEEILDIIITNSCKSFDDVLKHGAENISKYLHKPGLQSIVNNCLTFVKATGGGWSLENFMKFDPDPSAIHRVLLFQGIKPSDFDKAFYKWITKYDTKKNTILIDGPSNTGKSAFIAGMKTCIPWGEIVNSNTFAFEGLQDCIIGIWEEPLCSPELAEKAKQVLEGMPCSIPVKYKKPQLLPRTPIFITTNHDLWRFCQGEEPMFRNRMFMFTFKYTAKDALFVCRAREHSCECGPCTASRGGQDPISSSSSGTMPGGEQSIHPGQLLHAEQSSYVGSGPMSDPGEGTSRGPSSSKSSTNIQCTNRTELSSSSGSRNVIHMGTIGASGRSSGELREPGTIKQFMVPYKSGGHHGDNSSSDGSGRSRLGKRGRIEENPPKYDSSNPLGSMYKNIQAKTLSAPAKRQRVGKHLASTRMSTSKIPLYIPDKSAWQEYLSFLAHWYPQEELDGRLN
uniref:Nonstructural protein n=1 Tax=Parvoviridae sp. TaxID=1940570 RepID=A0A7D3QPS3_9VIRU|nr:MAG: nonstructural protein [Parvoviridae sp.]